MVCTKQFCSYRDRAEDFAALNATVVGVSSQDLSSHEAFIDAAISGFKGEGCKAAGYR